MSERRRIEVIYRGQAVSGEWWIENNTMHVTSSIGSKSGPAAALSGPTVSLPSSRAARMLWDLARANDPKRPLFYWR